MFNCGCFPSQGTPSVTDPDTYHTPLAEDMVKMSASLRAGTYDAGANLLRTCSLPDLTSLVADDPGPPAWDVGGHQEREDITESEPPETVGTVPESGGNHPKTTEVTENTPEPGGRTGDSVAQELGGDSDSEPQSKDDVFYEDAPAASEEGQRGTEGGESGEEEEEEGGEEEEEEEEDWSSSEDEDLQQLVQTLQTFVNEASE